MPKSRPILVGDIYWPPEKPRFIEYLNNSLREINISNIQECYLIGKSMFVSFVNTLKKVSFKVSFKFLQLGFFYT